MNIASAPTAAPTASPSASPSPSSGALASFSMGDPTPNQGSNVASTFLMLLTNVADALGPSENVPTTPSGKRNGKDDKKESVAALFGHSQMATQTDVFAGLTLQFPVFRSTGATATTPIGNSISTSAKATGLDAAASPKTAPDSTATAESTTKSQNMNLDFMQLVFESPADASKHVNEKTAAPGNAPDASSETSPAAPIAFAVKLTENATKDLQPVAFRGAVAAVNDNPAKMTVASPQLHDEAISQKAGSVGYTSSTPSSADRPQATTTDIPAVVGVAEQDPQPSIAIAKNDNPSPAPFENRNQTRVQSQAGDAPSVERNAITDRQPQQAQEQQQDQGEPQQKEAPAKSVQTKEPETPHSSEAQSQMPSVANTRSARDETRVDASPATANISGPQAVKTEGPSTPGTARRADTPNQVSSAEITETNSPVHLPSTREISMRIATPDSPNVDIKLVDRAGSVRVAVRTGDTDLARNLQGGLSDLVQKLEKQGFEAEPWSPDRSAGITTQQSQGNASGSNQQQQGSRDPRDASQQGNSGQQNGGRNRPRWVAELEEKFAATETERS